MSMCRVFSCVVGRGFAMVCYDQCVLLAKLYQPCPASFRIPRPNLPVTPGVSWLPTFAFQSPIMKRTSFWVLVLEGLVGLHRTVHLQLLQPYCLGHTWINVILNGLPWKQTEMILLFFRLHPSTAFRTLLLTMMATHFFWGLPARSSKYNGHLS